MFLTNPSFRSKIHDVLGDVDYTYWKAAELMLNQPWFVVELIQTESETYAKPVHIDRTMLLINIEDVENFLNEQNADPLLVEAVHVVTPKHINGSTTWRMDQLEAVWTGEEPKYPGRKVDVLYIKGGSRYAVSDPFTQVDSLINLVLRFRVR